ncbi:MAG TPA: hypothetical protein VFK85_06005 [Anaeromyxobacteraceae bacterium]|nr:hypothetical protein [Anaeromyxobacteraceae bacterium]
MSIERHSQPSSTEILVDGVFDRVTASRLQALVGDVDPGSLLTLDFREVRLFHDSAIASLAAALSAHPGARLVGLSEHHYRLLRYVASPSTTPTP